MNVVWQGFPGERTRSPAGSRNLNERCVSSLFVLSGSAAVAAGHLVSADPVEACGVVERRGEELVGEVVEELGGRWAGMQMGELGHRGVRRGVCNPLQPARSPALSEGLGAPGVDRSAPQGGQESFWHPRK